MTEMDFEMVVLYFSSGDNDFPELDFGDLPDPSEFDDLPPPPPGDIEAGVGTGPSSVSASGSADAGAGGGVGVSFSLGAGGSGSAGSVDGELPSTSMIISSYTWTPPGLTSDQVSFTPRMLSSVAMMRDIICEVVVMSSVAMMRDIICEVVVMSSII